MSAKQKTNKITETERLVLVVEQFKNELDLSDSKIKKILADIADKLPRSFPSSYGGRHKTPKNEDAPKGVINPFIFYTMEVRSKVKEEFPELTNAQIISKMSSMWNELGDSDKEKYNTLHKNDKERYDKEMNEYNKNKPVKENDSNDTEEEITDKKKKTVVMTTATKTTAYQAFCSENRETFKKNNKNLTGKEINKMLSDEWKKIKDDPEQFAEYRVIADTMEPKEKKPAKKEIITKQESKAKQAAKKIINNDSDLDEIPKETTIKKDRKLKIPETPKKITKRKIVVANEDSDEELS